MAKKRYVGYKYETLNSIPIIEGKGIEIVRRDGCEATSKIMSKCLKVLFETSDLSTVNFSFINIMFLFGHFFFKYALKNRLKLICKSNGAKLRTATLISKLF